MHQGFVRISHILGDPRRGIAPRIPVSRSTWWAGVASGRYPKPIKLSEGVTVWRVADIDALCDQIERRVEAVL